MIDDFLGGAITMGFAVAALLFLRFWRRTRQSLFLIFAGSFVLMSLAQAVLTLGQIPTENRSWVYLLRLAAFLLILGALWSQNRRGRKAG